MCACLHAQVLIRWGLQRGTSVVPKSELPERLRENIDVFDWSLPEDDFRALSSFHTQRRLVRGKFLLNPDGPYRWADGAGPCTGTFTVQLAYADRTGRDAVASLVWACSSSLQAESHGLPHSLHCRTPPADAHRLLLPQDPA